jgi:hypothetical protein
MGRKPAHPLLQEWEFPPYATCIILGSNFVFRKMMMTFNYFVCRFSWQVFKNNSRCQ